MAGVVLTLGPISFEDFEIPSAINFGGRQMVAVHRLTDGRRVVDCIGPDETEISFSGVFTGADATLRARLLNSIRTSGSKLNLTWDIFYYTVILSRFDASYQNPVWIPYRIGCTVVRDEAAVPPTTALSLSNSLLFDIENAASFCKIPNESSTVLVASLATPDATTPGSAAYAATQSGLDFMQSSIGVQISSEEAILQMALSPGASSAESLVQILGTATVSAQLLANLTNAAAYFGRAMQNLSNAST